MAERKSKSKPADSPPRDSSEGGQDGFPVRVPRSGTRQHHDRILSPAERRKRQEKRDAEQKARVDAQNADRAERTPKGWAGRRRER